MENLEIKVLVIDDFFENTELISTYLKPLGCTVLATTDPENALRLVQSENFDIVITDITLQAISGLEIIRHISENAPRIKIIVLTADTSVSTAVEAMKAGASDYVTKPFTEEKIVEIVSRISRKIQARRENVEQKIFTQAGIIGISSKMQDIYNVIKKASRTHATILISGESGTGKELVARAIHYTSENPQSPFVPVNCGGIPESLLESELFGYIKGAFTGANENRQGFFQTADKGTIFLDEIGEMSLNMQVKLLRVLQEKQCYMIGSRTPQQIKVRVIAATNKDLKILMEKNLFREDLFYRLHVISIALPALRERREDIPLLIQHFLQKYAGEFERKLPEISGQAWHAFKRYRWPGNVRELENVIQMLIALQENDRINIGDLPDYMRYSALKGISLNKTLEEVEMEYILRVISSVQGNKSQAAKILGIDRKTLWDKLKKVSKDQ